MKLTKNQQKELLQIKEYIPTNCQWQEENDSDIKKFFEWSERGLHREDATIATYLQEGRTYFHALVWGKKWRERHYAGI